MHELWKEIEEEMVRQREKWGGTEHDDQHTTWDWIVFITKHVGKAVKPGECNHLNVPTYRYQMIRVAAPAAQAVLWCDRNFKEDPLPLDE